MVKVLTFIKRKSGMPVDEFQTYWRTRHPDAVTRLRPGVLGAEGAAERESFASGLLEPPQYTRPEDFRGARVPGVLLSGDHARIARWRRLQALYMTWRRRPDLLATATLDADEKDWIERFERGETLPDDGRP